MAARRWRACRGARAPELGPQANPVAAFAATLITKLNPPRAHGLGNVLEGLRPKVIAGDLDLAPDLPIGVIGDANAARLGNALQSGSDIDAVAEDVVVVDDDVADVDADAKFDPVDPAVHRRSARPCRAGLRPRSATASTALANSTSMPSPVVLTMRPRCEAIVGSTRAFLTAFSRASVPSSSTPMRRL